MDGINELYRLSEYFKAVWNLKLTYEICDSTLIIHFHNKINSVMKIELSDSLEFPENFKENVIEEYNCLCTEYLSGNLKK